MSLDDELFDALNSAPNRTRPAFLDRSLYGDYEVAFDNIWTGLYDDFNAYGVVGKYLDEDNIKRSSFKIAYDRWQPKGLADTSMLPIIIYTHGVPVNRDELAEMARIVSRFAIVYTWDLLGNLSRIR